MGARSTSGNHDNVLKADGHLLEFLRSNFGFGGGGTNFSGGSSPGITASGGLINDYTDSGLVYRAHVFTSSGTFTVTDLGTVASTVEYLVVAGGGGAGMGGQSGGGGAGGLRTNLPGVVDASPSPLTISTPFPVTAGPTSYVVTVGAGGAGGAFPSNNPGSNGVNSYFGPPSAPNGITATAGGYGGGLSPQAANPGGSGGGSGNGPGTQTGGSGNAGGNIDSKPEGNSGGGAPGYSSQYYGGGGGGAGAAGTPGPGPGGAPGGIGVQVAIAGPSTASPVGTPGPSGNGWFAGGGGAGGNTGHQSPSATSAGGAGGGGTGSATGNGTAGTFSTGGGGGAGAYPSGVGKAGGSGIVVVRYQISEAQSGTAKASGGAISFYGSKTIHTFTSSGTFVNPSSIDNVEVVMVAGGGAGGNNIGGGGGAGAVLESPGTGFTFPNNTYTITVGAGGAGKTTIGPSPGNTANDTTISYPGPYTWTAQRGGHGSTYPNIAVQPGGSGGGSAPDPAAQAGGTSTAANSPTPIGTLIAYGNAGGSAAGVTYQGGGGGGAGAAGQNAPGPGVGGDGGVGRQLPTTFRSPVMAPSSSDPQPYQRGGGLGTPGPAGSYYVAGGGGGSAYPGNDPANRGLGGSGGGGDGGFHTVSPPNTDAQSALENTGSGGGGSGYSPSAQSTAGSGGSGIVLIAYPT